MYTCIFIPNQQYNDVSVLENHHAYIACELLRADATMLSVYLDKSNRRELRKIVITSILATDMAHHNKLCTKILQRDHLRPFRSDVVTDRQTLLNLCIHSADLSAQTLPWRTACQWEERISQEFSNQAEAEKARGLVPAPFMRNLDDMSTRGKAQRNFIDFVLIKLWDPVAHLFPQLRQCYDNLLKNRKMYEQRMHTGKSLVPGGVRMPAPLPTGQIVRRKSSSMLPPQREIGSLPESPEAKARGIASRYVLAHNVNRARLKLMGFAQKSGGPAKAD